MSNWIQVPSGKRLEFINEFVRIYSGITGLGVAPVSDNAKDGDHILIRQATLAGGTKTTILLRVGKSGKIVPEGPIAFRKRQGGKETPSLYRDLIKQSCKEIIRTI